MKSQKDAIYNHLKSGKSITPIEALNRYGSFRLGAIIHKLRREGYEIETKYITNKYGNKFAEYKMKQEPVSFKQVIKKFIWR